MTTGNAPALPVATTWFERTVVGPGVTRYREPHAHPLLRGNFYLVEGRDRNLVFDSGLGVVPLEVACPELVDGDPLLVLSHAHLDHAGGAAAFTHRRAHATEALILENPPRASLWSRELARAMGVETDGAGSGPSRPGARGELLINALPSAGYDPGAYEITPVSIERALEEGDVIDLGNRSLTVLHLPGHTPGSIGLLDEHDGTFFSGDVVYDDLLIDMLPEADVTAYRASLERLRSLPVAQVHGGHGDSFDRVRMLEICAAYLAARWPGSAHPPARA